LEKRETFFQNKYRRAIAELMDPEGKYFFQKYIRLEAEQY
jgi:hypothetical protein